MIKITNYQELSKYFDVPQAALDFLASANKDTECGKYVFSDDCFINVITVETTEEATKMMEAHVKFVDVQFMLDGEEKIYYTDKAPLELGQEYDEKKDRSFYKWTSADEITYQTGEGVVLYQNEAHLPGCAVNGAKTIKKAVIKIRYENQ